MKSNIPKPPTQGNQPNTTDQDYAIGDVVVRTDMDRNYLYEVLFVDTYSLRLRILAEPKSSAIWLAPYEVRPANVAELKAKRCLSETNQLLEVS